MARFDLSQQIPNLLYEAIAERGRVEERKRIVDAIFDQHGHDASLCFEVSEYRISCEYLRRIMITIGEWENAEV